MIGFTGLGCVVRDDKCQFIRARSKRLLKRYQSRIAEALSLKEALSWTMQWRSSKCVFETDAKILVDAINRQEATKETPCLIQLSMTIRN